VRPSWVTLELTETAAAANAADAIDILTRLRLMGFHLSIDDFGTGYSSLTQLHRLPFSELKIDKEFVGGCATSEENRVIVKTIVDLAHNLGLSVVAEGAEDEPTVDHLRMLRCDYVQGYYYSRPLEPDQTVRWMDGWAKEHTIPASAPGGTA
jgi:EAL domain-containing protein (putative c-di-GMP-specific phosphodiesterase class I)